MTLGLFLRRELTTSVRRGSAFTDRWGAVLWMTAIVTGCILVWDWKGWDRASVAGAASFALTTFGLIVAAQSLIALGIGPAMVAPIIASERDRKSLDSLLATPLSAAEIVLGTIGAGLLRYLNGLAALGPILTLIVILGGIDPRLVLLACAGIASTAFTLAALATAVSVGARTATWATSSTIVLAMTWMFLPLPVVMLLPRYWPAAGPWGVPIAMGVIDSSPFGVGLNLLGVIPRGPLVGAVLRMIALQTAAAVVLVLWAIIRLRPASRAVYDMEGRTAILRLLHARWRPRPACGDDPVLWREMYPARAMSIISSLVDQSLIVLGVGMLAYVTSWFAVPAFAELSRSGYGPTPGEPTFPELNPFARLLVAKWTPFSLGPAPGQARLEFNIVLRQMTGLLDLLFVLMVAGTAAESVVMERERATWLGLIVTPLTGWEILRAKMLGSIWRARGVAFLMLALWVVGLLAGALHPLGFLAALAGMGVSSGFLAALGVSISMWSRDRGQATGRVLGPLMLSLGLSALPFIVPGMASVLLAAGTMPFLTWVSLVSYDDVHTAIRSGAIPQFAVIGIRSGEGARIVLAAWLVSTIAQAIGAFLLTRSAIRGFEAAVGRPTRPRGDVGVSRAPRA